jgi:hypothetical protein
MVPGARETVSVDSVASGRRSAPSPPSGIAGEGATSDLFVASSRQAPRDQRAEARRDQQTRIARGKSEPGLREGYESERPYGNTAEYLSTTTACSGPFM